MRARRRSAANEQQRLNQNTEEGQPPPPQHHPSIAIMAESLFVVIKSILDCILIDCRHACQPVSSISKYILRSRNEHQQSREQAHTGQAVLVVVVLRFLFFEQHHTILSSPSRANPHCYSQIELILAYTAILPQAFKNFVSSIQITPTPHLLHISINTFATERMDTRWCQTQQRETTAVHIFTYLAEEPGEFSLVVRLRRHLLASTAEHSADLSLVLLWIL